MNATILSIPFCVFWVAALAQLSCAAGEPADPSLKGFEEHAIDIRVGSEGKDTTVHYLLLKPEKIEPGKTYPVVLFLHGAGERGSDDRAQLKYFPEKMSSPAWRKKYPAFVIAPQCPKDKKWVEVNWSDHHATPQAAHPNETMQAVIAMLQEVLKSEPADRKRVYLTGLSMGGYGAWDLATRHPDWFAAVAPICGGGDPAKAATLKDLPLWAFHGDRDPAVPVARSREMIEAIRKAGGKPKYTEYPGVGHNSWEKAYADDSGLMDWMFQQVRPQ